jgi:hypothetical protein
MILREEVLGKGGNICYKCGSTEHQRRRVS